MNTNKHSSLLAAIAVSFLVGAPVGAVTCDKVAADVRAAIEASPSKVLVIVEDAMVANESCACEIVKSALSASKAGTDLARQIVLTATNVAPNLAQQIAECARAYVGASGGKEVKNVEDIQPVSSGPDYKTAPADIRGVYLIQPSAGGIVTKDCDCDDEPKRRQPPKHEPQSPSCASRH